MGLGQRAQAVREQRLDHPGGGANPAVEVHGAEQRLERVGEDRAAAVATALHLAAAEAQLLAEPQLGGDLCQRTATHQRRTVAAQLALVGVGAGAVEQRGDGEIEHRVPHELEPLVVAAARAAVGQRRLEQRRIAELVLEPRLSPFAGSQQAGLTAGR